MTEEQIAMNTDVLVIGGGIAGQQTAAEVAQNGYRVSLIDATDLPQMADAVSANDPIDVMTETCLVGASGVAGNFNVQLKQHDQIIQKQVGAMVLATDMCKQPLHDAYGLALSDTVITQSSLDALLADNPAALANRTIAFVVGLAQESNPVVLERVLRAILDIQKIEGCTVYVYTGNLKVAADGLERLYKAGRDQGATYFKLTERPTISPNGASVAFHDPVLRRDIEIAPDLLVIEEALVVDDMAAQLAQTLRIDTSAGNFLQIDNVHRYPVATNREGIYVVGGARDVMPLPAARADVGNVVLRIKQLLGRGETRAQARAVLDTGKCTFCLTCFRCCPHGAIYWAAENKPVISPVACQACGICASECPMDAIQIVDFTDDQMLTQLENSAPTDSAQPSIVAFCCQNSAFEAAQMAATFNMRMPAGLRLVKVPCAGKVDIEYILSAFGAGADGVLVVSCHTGNCKSERGNTFAGWRVTEAQRMLEEAGMNKDRLVFATMASNMAHEFSKICVDLEAKIRER